MKSNRITIVPLLMMALSFTSCGDKPELVEKREKQRTEITRLKGELALIDEKLKNLPPDVSTELAEAKDLATKQETEISTLEGEVADLEARKKALEEEFAAYKAKYSVQ